MNWRIRTGLSLWLLTLAIMAATCVAGPTAQAAKTPVPACRIVHGKRVCFPVAGGSGITPPVLQKPVR